jgi:two-component sensor histidine kinase
MDSERYEEAIDVLTVLKSTADWMGNPSNARRTVNNLGYCYFLLQNYPESALNYEDAILLAEELQDTTKWVTSQMSLAMAYREMGLYAKSILVNQEALRLSKIRKDWENQSSILNAIGITYQNLGEWDKAIDLHREALGLVAAHADSLMVSYLMTNLAISHEANGMIDSSLYYNRQSLEIKKLLQLDQTSNLNNIGEDYLILDSLDLAAKYLTLANEGYLKKADKNGLIGNYNNLAKLSLKKAAFNEAELFLKESLKLLQETEVKHLYLDYLSLYTALLEGQNRFVEALESYKKLATLREEIFQSEKLDVQRVEAAYALREKDLEAQNLAQEAALAKAASKRNAQLMLFLLFGLVAASVVAFFFIRLNRKLAESNKLILLQKLDLKHATFNTLNRIQSMLRITSHSMPDIASKEKLYQVESAILSAASLQQFTYGIEHKEEGSLGQFLKELVGRLKEAYSSSGHVDISYLVEIREDAVLPVNTLLNCGMMVGEMVTNAVKYAFENEPEPKISICLSRLGRHYLLQLGDNGVGMAVDSRNHGVGADLLRKLAKLMKAELTVRNEGGTWYTIKFKA